MQKLRDLGDEQALTIIVGNKLDQEKERVILESDGAEYAKENNAAFFEISAQSGFNVQEVFDTLIKEIYNDIKLLETQSKSLAGTNLSKSNNKSYHSECKDNTNQKT